MPIVSLEQRITAAQKKLDQLKARQRAIVNRLDAIRSERTKKDNTRRKILAGAWVLARRRDLIPDLRSFLTRPQDRALFVEPDSHSDY